MTLKTGVIALPSFVLNCKNILHNSAFFYSCKYCLGEDKILILSYLNVPLNFFLIFFNPNQICSSISVPGSFLSIQ